MTEQRRLSDLRQQVEDAYTDLLRAYGDNPNNDEMISAKRRIWEKLSKKWKEEYTQREQGIVPER